MLRICVGTCAAFAATLATVGCSSTPGMSTGECSARVRVHGEVFVPNNRLNQRAPRGAELGPAEVIDCGDADSAKTVQKVRVYRVVGVRDGVALAVGKGTDYEGVYVNADVPSRQWPDPLRKR